jgi:integrase
MAGQLIQRGPRSWLVRTYLGRHPDTGKRRYHNRTVHGSKKDAERYLLAALRERDLGSFVEGTRLTVSEYFDQWLASAARGRVRERTYRDYTAVVKRYVRPTLGARRLIQLRPLEIQGLYAQLQERGLSARTIRYLHAILSAALRQAVKWRLLAQSPTAFVDLPRRKRAEPRILMGEEVTLFLTAAAADRFSIVFTFALATGMRPGEYLALRWADLDLDHGRVVVVRAVVWQAGTWSFTEPKTSRSRRSIPLPPSVVRLLREHRRLQAAERLVAGPRYRNLDLVFATETGTPIDLRNLSQRHFKAVLKAAGLPATIRLYDLRHTSATLLLTAGVHPKVVSERLGHATITLTLDTYSHVLPTIQQGAADRLEEALFGTTQETGNRTPRNPVST